MARAEKVAAGVLTTVFSIVAVLYDGTIMRIVLWTLAAASATVLVIGYADTATAQARRPWLVRLPFVQPRSLQATPGELVARLTLELQQGDALRDDFSLAAYPPFFTAEYVGEPIGDALGWAKRVEHELREHAAEWLPEFRAAGYEIPPELEPGDVTVAEVEAMLAARVVLLGRIIRALKGAQ